MADFGTTEKLPITAVVATKNEAVNIRRCLASLAPARAVFVVDSKSTDGTPTLARNAGADVYDFTYAGGYPKKRQWALDHLPISTEWIFFVDADETIPSGLWAEISRETAKKDADAYLITKGFHFMGKRFRFGGFSHAAVLLFRRGFARFEQVFADEPPDAPDMEIHERLLVDGRIKRLETPLIHHDFKGLSAYIDRHNRYSTWEAENRYQYLTTGRWGVSALSSTLFGNVQQQRRYLKSIAVRIPGEPVLWFLYHYGFRLGFLEGRRGLIASRIRANYIADVRAKLFELRLAASDVRGRAGAG